MQKRYNQDFHPRYLNVLGRGRLHLGHHAHVIQHFGQLLAMKGGQNPLKEESLNQDITQPSITRVRLVCEEDINLDYISVDSISEE